MLINHENNFDLGYNGFDDLGTDEIEDDEVIVLEAD